MVPQRGAYPVLNYLAQQLKAVDRWNLLHGYLAEIDQREPPVVRSFKKFHD